MDQIRGLFTTPFRSGWAAYGIDYEHFSAMGCTDVFMNGSALGINSNQYNSSVQQLKEMVSLLDGTGLNLWFDTTVFLTTTTTPYVWTDPTDETHADLVASQIAQILEDVPELKGITFDDYNWQPHSAGTGTGFWPGSDGQSYEYPELAQSLADFGSRMADIVHDADKLIGCSIPVAVNTLGANTKLLGNVFDFISPECYVYDPTICTQAWFEKMMLDHIKLLPNPSKFVPLLSTYNPSNQNKLKTSNVECIINTALTANSNGYILFSEGSMNNDITFLSQSDFQLNTKITMDNSIIPEKSSRKFTITLTDASGNSIPDTVIKQTNLSYKILDEITDTVIVPSTSINLTGSITSILLTSEQNRILNQSLNQEQRRITVSITYGNGLEENKEFVYTVKNLSGII